MTVPLTIRAEQDHEEKAVVYFRLDPTRKKPPKRITKRQFDRGKNFITFHAPPTEGRS